MLSLRGRYPATLTDCFNTRVFQSFAKKYKPELVIDLATLTGAAVAAIGHYGFVSMHEGAKEEHAELKKVGDKVHERLA